MDAPVFCCENLLDAVVQYPAHTLAANEEATGHEAWRVANARRHPTDFWTPTTANAAAYLDVTFGQDRTFDFFALDRGHNLGGETVRLQNPDSAYANIVTAVIPAASTDGVALSTGALTRERAYVRRFTPVTASGVRIRIEAMGAGLLPKVVGLWVGRSWQPTELLPRPVTFYPRRIAYESTDTPAGWRGSGWLSARREGEYRIRLRTFDATDAERFLDRYSPQAPAWIVADSDAAERAFLAQPPSGAQLAPELEARWAYPIVTVPFLEHEPVP